MLNETTIILGFLAAREKMIKARLDTCKDNHFSLALLGGALAEVVLIRETLTGMKNFREDLEKMNEKDNQ